MAESLSEVVAGVDVEQEGRAVVSHGALAPHEAARCQRTRGYYRDFLGVEAESRRAAEISALPAAEWKGRSLRTIRCHGTSGKGPHDCNVPESMLWALIGLVPFYCVYHRDDAVVDAAFPVSRTDDHVWRDK